MKICPACQTRYEDDVETCANDGEALDALAAVPARGPAMLEGLSAVPSERTSMIDLEALEAQRRQRQQEAEEAPGEAADESTPPPVDPVEEDEDATGTLRAMEARARRKARKGAPRPAAGDDNPAAAPGTGDAADAADADGRDADPGTARSRRRAAPPDDAAGAGADGADGGDDDDDNMDTGMRTGMTRPATRAGTRAGTRTGMTRQTARMGTRAGTRTGMTRPGTRVAEAPARRRTVTGIQAGFLALVVVLAFVGGVIAVSRATAVLTVTTVPPGASVTLDGDVIGVTPIQKRVRTGSHTVELTLDGFESFKEVVSVLPEGLPFLQPLQKKAAPPPPPPTPSQIADELVQAAATVLNSGDAELARRKLDEALLLVPGHLPARALLPSVDAALEKRNAELRRSEATVVREARLRQARALAAEGRDLYEKGQMARAREKLYASLKLDAGNPEPHRTLGRIFNREDQVDKVRYHLQRYIDLGGADGDFKVREWLKAHPR